MFGSIYQVLPENVEWGSVGYRVAILNSIHPSRANIVINEQDIRYSGVEGQVKPNIHSRKEGIVMVINQDGTTNKNYYAPKRRFKKYNPEIPMYSYIDNPQQSSSGNYGRGHQQSSNYQRKTEVNKCKKLEEELGLNSKKDSRAWLLQNHPDKYALASAEVQKRQTELTALVLDCYKSEQFSWSKQTS